MEETPQQTVDRLVRQHLPWVAGADRYNQASIHHESIAKKCALISVMEIIRALENHPPLKNTRDVFASVEYLDYWKTCEKILKQ